VNPGADEAIEANLMGDQIQNCQMNLKGESTNLQPFGMSGQSSADASCERNMLTKRRITGKKICSPKTFKFNSGPNLGLFMYTSPALEMASLTSELFKKSPCWSWTGACATLFSFAHDWNLKLDMCKIEGNVKRKNAEEKK
jgi:hypothetical protein